MNRFDVVEADNAPETSPSRYSRPRIILAAVAAGVILAIAYLVIARSAQKDAEAGPAAPASVVLARALQREVPIVLEAPGTVTPFNSVTVRSRIDGELLSVLFREGDDVRTGQVLARIDPRPMRASWREASASLRRDRSRLENAAIEFERAQALSDKGFVTKSSLDAKRTEMEQAKAETEASRGVVDRSALDLEYTTIRSPISGRTGFRLIDPGSLVSAAERSAIVVVTQQQPIAVVFSLPQKDLGAVARGLDNGSGLEVELTDGRSDKVIARGRVTTFDNAIDRQSGTFQVKASFPNADRSLWPGQFVKVRLIVERVPNGIVVPAEAVQRGPDGDFVFVVDARKVARVHAVTVDQRVDGEALISHGLSGNETVVVDGQYGLRSGTPVRTAEASGR